MSCEVPNRPLTDAAVRTRAKRLHPGHREAQVRSCCCTNSRACTNGSISSIAACCRSPLLPSTMIANRICRVDAERRISAAILGAGLRALRKHLTWLVSGGLDDIASSGSFADRIILTHDNQLRAALRVLVLSTAVIGGWVTLVPLAGAVVLPGTLVVELSVKKIQHPNGGVVATIPVQDGMHVSAGALLVQLDETQVQANEQLVADQLDQVRARIARLIGERDGLSGPQLSRQLADRINDPGVAKLVAAETALFNARLTARQGQKQLYQSNIRQFNEQIDGLTPRSNLKLPRLVSSRPNWQAFRNSTPRGLCP